MGGRQDAAHFYTPATLPEETTPPIIEGDTLTEQADKFTRALGIAEKSTFRRLRVDYTADSKGSRKNQAKTQKLGSGS